MQISDKIHFLIKSNCSGDLEAQIAAVEESQAILKASTDSILTLTTLMPIMDTRHCQQFEDLANQHGSSSFKSNKGDYMQMRKTR